MTPEQQAMEDARKGNADKSKKNAGKNKEKFSKIAAQQNLDSMMNSEDIQAEAQEFVDNGQGQELAAYKESYNSPNTAATQEAVATAEANQPPATPPAQPVQQAMAETVNKVKEEGKSVQQAATETALDRFVNNVSNGDEDTAKRIREMFARFMEGKLPQGSKPFLIMNAIATAGQNIANMLATSEYNNRWSTIQSGQYKTPEFQTSLMQDLKAKGIQGQQDLMSEILAADAKEQLTGEGQRKKTKEEIENASAATDLDIKKETGMEAAKADVEGKKLANEAASLDNLSKKKQLAWFDKLQQVDYETQKAALRNLNLGGIKGKISVPGFGEVTADAATIAYITEQGAEATKNLAKAIQDKWGK